jgi:hypothetical protein
MFVRNGQALGSVLAEPKARPKPQKEKAPEPVPEPVVEPVVEATEVLEPPKHYDQKSEWVAYVVAKTKDTDKPVSEDEADAMTKSDLIELYGG